MATIKDVAQMAGVAISTASAALNRSAPVSDEVIAKVEAAVREIGYVPHGGARSLRMGRSRLIGLILPDITNPHFAKVAKVVESACLSAGYMVAVYSTERGSRSRAANPDDDAHAAGRRVDHHSDALGCRAWRAGNRSDPCPDYPARQLHRRIAL